MIESFFITVSFFIAASISYVVGGGTGVLLFIAFIYIWVLVYETNR